MFEDIAKFIKFAILFRSVHDLVRQFGLERCQKKRKVMNYRILKECFEKHKISVRIRLHSSQLVGSVLSPPPYIIRSLCTLH